MVCTARVLSRAAAGAGSRALTATPLAGVRHLSTTAAAASSVVPNIDVAPFFSGCPEGKGEVVAQIRSACEDIGFFSIRNHGVPQHIIDAAWSETRNFFDLTEGEKMTGTGMTEDYPYGYLPLGSEKLAAGKDHEMGREDEELPSDLNESFAIGPLSTQFGAPAVRWPVGPAGFRPAWAAYYQEMEKLSAGLLRAFALGLELPEDWFEDKIDQHRCALRTLNYPEPPADSFARPGQLRASAHTDYGTLTLLLQGAEAAGGQGHPGNGLQVMASDGRSGEWSDVPYIPGSFVVNLGDLMSRWTNERWVSTLHRVVMPPPDKAGKCRRQSMAFFHNINPDHIVQCIPSCTDPTNPPRYPPIKAFDFLMAKHTAATAGEKGQYTGDKLV